MNEAQAKKQLRKMLQKLTPGSLLHLMGDLYRENAEECASIEDSAGYERWKSLECTLFVMGLGLDAACPSS